MSGPVSAPYWGVLPVPKSRRATSDNYSPADSHRDSFDLASQPLPRSNRASSQTVRTDAPTESTFSPLTSPTASSFRASGLAPPPPSQPYDRPPDEPSEKRYRRTARFHEDLSEDPARATPPAAPDVPRAPPLSFSPYGNGRESPYTFTASGQPGPPPSAHRSMAQARAADLGRSQPYQDDDDDDDDELAARRAARAARNGNAPGDFGKTKSERRAENAPRPVRMPFDDPSPSGRRGGQRSSTWAADRSPLQKLELTLGSITKEEKRARVEAAEQRAREKAALAAQHAQEGSPSYPSRKAVQQGRARDQRPPVGQDARQRRDPPGAAPSPATRDQASQFPPEIPGLYDSSTQTLPPPLSVTKNRDVAEPQKFDMPQRNFSFRDRTSQDTQDARRSDEASPTKPKRTISLTRKGSNKLKKNPPGDPWYGQRTEAERKVSETGHAGKAPARHAPVARNASQKRPLTSQDTAGRPPVRGNNEYDEERDLDDAYAVMQGMQAAPTGLGRSAFLGANGRQFASGDSPPVQKPVKTVTFPDDDPRFSAVGDDESDAESEEYHHLHRDNFQPGRGMYQEPIYLDEWRKGTVGTLAGALLDITAEVPAPPESSDSPGRRRSSLTSKARKGEAFDGEYDETQAPTRFKPPLYLECGPLLRYCGLRHEKVPARNHSSNVVDREIWRGSVMIVTQDSESSYEIVPILRLFVQPMDLLPPPPAELRGGQSLSPEYVDPIAGLPKLGRRGETQYVRPVEHLEEAKDASMLEPDDGLFEITRSAPDFSSGPEPRESFTSRRKRVQVDGERLGKYKDVRGFRLHTERGCTFWRFNIEVELRARQQRIAYRINRGPSMGFWVPARGQAMNIMFHSCNGFSRSVNPDDLSGPDPMWRDVLNNHQTRPFHVMVGGGDQIYNDAVMDSTKHFHDWLEIKNPLHKNNAPFTARMQDELEAFYLERYCMWFSQGLFGLANSQIPMVNMYDDHDIIDGFGSYPHHFMKTPVFSGLGNVAFKYYMLFQHQSLPVETEQAEPSWVLGCKPGPYIQQHSRSLYMSMGGGTALLAVDARTERTLDEVVREDTWKKIIDRCYAEINKGQTRHLLVLLGVPIAYPRLVWLENILTSRLMDPVKALGKAGLLGNFLNKFDGGVEVLDDLDDHWTSKNHKEERKFVVEDLQDLAADKSVRITILSGDVHLAAVGQFYSNPKLHIPKHRDFRYMPNVVSSAIVNTPPPDLMADVLNKRNKVHHFDKETDEDMIPLFTTGVDGKPRNNKRLLPHRNWCAIREYEPGSTPPPTPPPEDYDQSPEGSPPPPPGNKGGGGLLRRLSLSKTRGPAYRPDMPEEKDRSRPPVTGGLLRRLSRRASTSDPDKRPNKLKRSLSLGGRGDGGAAPKGGLFGRRPSVSSSQAGGGGGGGGGMGMEGQYYSEDNLYGAAAPPPPIQTQRRVPPDAFDQTAYYDSTGRLGLRGGAGGHQSEFEAGDDAYFTARPPHRAYTQPATNNSNSHHQYPHNARDYGSADAVATPPGPRPFHRTPTGLSAKQLRKNPERYEVDLEGGLEVTLNVEVNARDPAGITVPYRLLVPKLVYEYQGEDAPSERSDGDDDDENPDDDYVDEDAGIERPPLSGGGGGGGIRRWFSGRRSSSQYRDQWGGDDTQYPPGHERGF